MFRLCRRRFWKGDYGKDKLAAYQTLYECLEKVSVLSAPIAPFFSDRLFKDLNLVSGRFNDSVHIAEFPAFNEACINRNLEQKMSLAQRITSMVLGLRKQQQIKVRQPLQKLMLPSMSEDKMHLIKEVSDLILREVNVKELEFMSKDSNILVKQIKPDFKSLGPRFGKQMKSIAGAINDFGQDDIAKLESQGKITLEIDGIELDILLEDTVISTKDVPGWLVSTDGDLTVALDFTITDELKDEGIAREFVNRIQNLRKDSGLDCNR